MTLSASWPGQQKRAEPKQNEYQVIIYRNVTGGPGQDKRDDGYRGSGADQQHPAGMRVSGVACGGESAHDRDSCYIIYGTLDTQTSTVQGVPQIAEFQAYSS